MSDDETDADDNVDQPTVRATQVEQYAGFEIDLPGTDHPFSALKSHTIQFGMALGISLSLLATSETQLVVDVGPVVASTSGLALASVGMVAILLWAVGIENAGVIQAARADESSIGVAQIRRKPHYLTTAMVVTFLIGLVVLPQLPTA